MSKNSNDYRKGVKNVGNEVPFTLWTLLKWAGGIVIVLSILVFLAEGLGIIQMDIHREKIQHSQQYTETKVSLLEKLQSDWYQLDAEIVEMSSDTENYEIIVAKKAQQKSIVNRMKTEANRIPKSELSSDLKNFISNHSNRN